MRFGVCLHAGAVARASLGLHPNDRAAIALARAAGAEVVVLEGIAQRGTAPRAASEALSAGAARAIRLVDPALQNADAQATAFALATALDSLQVDLVLFGDDADPEGAQDVPACIAHHMSAVYLDQVLTLNSLVGDPAQPDAAMVEVDIRASGWIRRIRVPMNAVLGVAGDGIPAAVAPPPSAAPAGAVPAGVEVVNLTDLNVDPVLVRSHQDRRGAIDAAARPLVTLQSAAAIAALLRR